MSKSKVLYRSKLEAWMHSGVKARLEQQARYADAELRPILRAQRYITFYPEGGLVQVEGSDDYEPHEREHSPRGKIDGFSAKSRGRLISLCARIRKGTTALFLTLTWPGVWSETPCEWKRCLDVLLKRMHRAYVDASAIWKLEPQERGAPHYHLLVFGVDFIPHQVLAQWWFEIVGSGDERHLHAGISIEAVRSREDVMHYASKMYMGKTIEGFSGVGRFWGVFNRGKLPLSKAVRVDVAQPVLVHFQRIARRFIQSQMKASFLWKRTLGKRVRWRRYRCGKPARILVGDPVQWLRVGEWAEGEFQHRLRAAGHPF